MEIELYPPMLPSRACRFCLCVRGGCVFADFDVDSDGRVFVVRISYDGYGCCGSPEVSRMSPQDSAALLAMVERGTIDVAIAEPILRAYFQANREVLWSDALAEHDLLPSVRPPPG